MKFLTTIKPRLRGPEGYKVQLNATETHLQWKLEGASGWTDLASLDDLSPFSMPKTGGAFTGNVQVRSIIETKVTPAGSISGNVALDLSLGNVFDIAPTGNITGFNLTNVPQAITGNAAVSFTIIFNQATTNLYTLDFKFKVGNVNKTILWAGGFEPYVSATYSAADIFTFLTADGGNTWFGFVGGQGY
jgi:hypothetical protein